MERGRGFGEGTLPSPPLHRLSHPWGPPPATPCVATATSAHPSRGTQDPSRTLRAHRLARSPAPKGSQDFHFCPAAYTFQPAQLFSSCQLAPGFLSTWGGWRRLSLPEGFPVPGAARQVFLPGFLLRPDGEPSARAVW